MRVSWTCPEDRITVVCVREDQVEEMIRAHFAHRVHEHLSLAGFTMAGPVIQGSLPEAEVR